jgi:anti-sigma factor RsiW
MIVCTRVGELLDDYVDGLLPEAVAREIGGHLSGCEACARDERGLRAVLRLSGELPPELEPRRDLWPGVRDGIAARKGLPARSGRWASPVRLAAAAAALVVVTSAATVWLVHRQTSYPPRPQASPELASLRASEPDYIQARRTLYAALQQRRSHLSPQTVKVIDRNLAVMDQALSEMKLALEKDPGNRGLAVLIESTYRQEIQLLMQVSSLPSNA